MHNNLRVRRIKGKNEKMQRKCIFLLRRAFSCGQHYGGGQGLYNAISHS